jgi:putative adenylate-forming enzyme
MHTLRTREQIEQHQTRQLASFLKNTVANCDRYRHTHAAALSHLPVIDKRDLLADFSAFNSGGLTVDEVRAALISGQDRIRGYVVGQSTGTSGNRGYYVVSDAERFVWLGTILAKALPEALWQSHRVALALPGLSTLYRSASNGSRITLGFFDLAEGVEAWALRLAEFRPDTIVAPPKVLRHLAQAGQLQANNIFSGAEVLDPIDRGIIEQATGRRVREIYMATEGLLGVACPHGTLHLAEDTMHFEWLQQPNSRLVMPVITDFTRRVQVMARYRMNDLLELTERRCACGSPLQAVARIEGRQDDVFHLAGHGGETRMLTPDILRNTVVDTDTRIDDFRIIQKDPHNVEIRLHKDLPEEVTKAVHTNMLNLLARLNCDSVNVDIQRGIVVPFERKLRRVYREQSAIKGS